MRIVEPYNGKDLQWHPVTPAMSKTSFQGPECCKPLKRKSITTFFQPKAAPGKLLIPDAINCRSPLHKPSGSAGMLIQGCTSA